MYVLMIDETSLNSIAMEHSRVSSFMLGRSINEWVCYVPAYGVVRFPCGLASSIQRLVCMAVEIAEPKLRGAL